MAQFSTKIALIFDCDDTLSGDTTAWLLDKCGEEPNGFFSEAGKSVNAGCDPPLAYLNKILEESQDGKKLDKLKKPYLDQLSNSCDGLFFPGTSDLFDRLKSQVESVEKFKEIGIQVSCYIISGGIEEFISNTPVGKTADMVWGSGFNYDEYGRPISLKNVMSFTEKTRYIFCINKGVEGQARSKPYIDLPPLYRTR